MNQIPKDAKKTAIISYITVIGSIIAIFRNNDNKNDFASFHIRQALGINLTFYIFGYLIGYFDSWMISCSYYFFIILLWTYGFLGALQTEKKSVPLLGNFYQKVFQSI